MSCAIHAEVEEGLRRCARCQREFCSGCTIVVQDDVPALVTKERTYVHDLAAGTRVVKASALR